MAKKGPNPKNFGKPNNKNMKGAKPAPSHSKAGKKPFHSASAKPQANNKAHPVKKGVAPKAIEKGKKPVIFSKGTAASRPGKPANKTAAPVNKKVNNPANSKENNFGKKVVAAAQKFLGKSAGHQAPQKSHNKPGAQKSSSTPHDKHKKPIFLNAKQSMKSEKNDGKKVVQAPAKHVVPSKKNEKLDKKTVTAVAPSKAVDSKKKIKEELLLKNKKGAKESDKKVSKKDEFLEMDTLGDEAGFDDEDFDKELEELEKAAPAKKSSRKQEIEELEGKIAEELVQLRESFNWNDIKEAVASLDYFVNSRTDECMEKGCDNLRTTQGFCRLHYIKNWKNIKKKREILSEGKLQEYIEDLISKYPPKIMEMIMADLVDDREFYKVLSDLNIISHYSDEEAEFEATETEDDDDITFDARNFSAGKIDFEDDGGI